MAKKTYYDYEVLKYNSRKRKYETSQTFSNENSATTYAKDNSRSQNTLYAVKKVGVRSVFNNGNQMR